MTRVLLLVLVLLSLAGIAPPAASEPLPVGWQAAMAAGGEPVQVTVKSVALPGAKLSSVTLVGAWVLTADRPEFGGFSGVLVRGGRLYAVSDNAWWLGAEFTDTDGAPLLRNATMAPIRDPLGRRYDRFTGDAKSLAWDGERLAVAFERDNRIMRLGEDGRTGSAFAPDAFDQLDEREGIEAIASLPGDGLIAIAQERRRTGAPVFVLGGDEIVAEASLPVSWLNKVTGADLGPDGQLYLVQQERSDLFGIVVQVVRYRLDRRGLPRPESAEVLAEFGAASGIENMEGIAVETLADGAIRLWLISDDNFSEEHPTLLVGLNVLP